MHYIVEVHAVNDPDSSAPTAPAIRQTIYSQLFDGDQFDVQRVIQAVNTKPRERKRTKVKP